MERDFKKELANFAAVWQRVCRGQGKIPGGMKLMPGKCRQKPPRGRGADWRR